MSRSEDPDATGAHAPPSPPPSMPHEQGEMWADDGTSRAEIRVEEDRLEVTLAVPDIESDALEHFVGSNIVVLWSRNDPETQRTVVRLPEDVVPHSSVARVTNGVFDLTVLLAHPDHHQNRPDGSA